MSLVKAKPKPKGRSTKTTVRSKSSAASNFSSAADKYNADVKKTFQHEPNAYETFRSMVQELRTKKIGEIEAADKIVQLFEGHPNLIKRFVMYVTRDHDDKEDAGVVKVLENIRTRKYALKEDRVRSDELMKKLTGKGKKQKVVFGPETVKFVGYVKKTFKKTPDIYLKFVCVLQQYHDGTISDMDAIRRVVVLFQKYPLLVMEFNRFLPDEYHIEYRQTPIFRVKRTDDVGVVSYVQVQSKYAHRQPEV